LIDLFARRLTTLAAVALAACGGVDPGNDPTGITDLSSCTASNTIPVALAVGEFRLIDPVHQSNCISLPASASAQEYVVVAYSGYGVSTTNGTSADYALQSKIVSTASSSVAGTDFVLAGTRRVIAPRTTPANFERTLRLAERALARSSARHFGAFVMPPAAPPALGDRDSFNVCATPACSSFTRVGATVTYVGAPGIIYLDDKQNSGAEQFIAADFQQLGQLFDNYLYPTDTTAFGRESDINHDQHIAILMTPAVNALTSDCTNGRVIGYTFANDLIPSAAGSNAREMFYALTTSVATSLCDAVTRASALVALPPTLIHELQHMISFNQHVLLLNGDDQDVWVNEGLSQFAEELGWRTVPVTQCVDALDGDCFNEFLSDNVSNAFDYLVEPEDQYLIAPEATDGTLPERGAAWLFLRWLADHYSADSVLGTQFTRGVEQSTLLGAARIAQLTGVGFPTLVGEWQLSNWTNDLPGFPQGGLLSYTSWNFRDLFAANYPSVFPVPFPLIPDSTTGTYSHPGTLRAGSGRTVRYELLPGSPGATIRMAGSLTNGALDGMIVPYLAIVRVQ
jgi:hypothetical protein